VPITIEGEVHRVPRAMVRAIQRGYIDPTGDATSGLEGPQR
jgi:hypothetical protein